MTSDRLRRQIDRLLDEADDASVRQDWQTVHDRATSALAFDPANADARGYLEAAVRAGYAPVSTSPDASSSSPSESEQALSPPKEQDESSASGPSAFANGRYVVRRFLGEGGKKRVYLAHDSLLDRDVAFALIKTEGLDTAARERVGGKGGAHDPHPNPLPLGEG